MPTHVDCHEIADFAFHAGEAFILIALAMGALIALADVMAPPPKPGKDDKALTVDAGDIIRALKDAPVWFALFVAGGALLWFAGDTVRVCP
jgi:hypothetical protein